VNLDLPALIQSHRYLVLVIGCLLEGETLLALAGFAAHPDRRAGHHRHLAFFGRAVRHLQRSGCHAVGDAGRLTRPGCSDAPLNACSATFTALNSGPWDSRFLRS
jgi:hypothetical protein